MKSVGFRTFDRLGFRMALSLAVILLPLAIVSILRSQAAVSETQARNEAALFGETVRMAGTELALIDRARGIASTVGAIAGELQNEPALCNAALRRVSEISELAFVGFIRPDGSVPCSSIENPPSFAGHPDLLEALSNPREIIRRTREGFVSGQRVIYITRPVYAHTSALLGFAVASIPHEVIIQSREGQLPGTHFLTINQDSEILTSSLPIRRAISFLPSAGMPDRFLVEGGTFQATADNGTRMFYAVMPLAAENIAMVGLWSEESANKSIFYLQAAPIFPVLMWIASLLVGWLMVEFLVTRHVKSLVTAMRDFTKNRRTEMPQTLASAPVELRDFGDAYVSLTDNIVRDEAKLEDALFQKNILLREVHHRTKNNLQLIASIMSMQMRRTESPEVKEVMAILQDRVLTLATIHKSLYQTSGLASIKLDELLADIVTQMQMVSQHAKAIDIETDYDAVQLLPDQAVPFSLLVTEALTNAFKYSSADAGQTPKIQLVLRDLGEARISLMIENTRRTDQPQKSDPHSTGLGAQLMAAFATQLGTEMTVEESADFYRLSIAFDAAPLDQQIEIDSPE